MLFLLLRLAFCLSYFTQCDNLWVHPVLLHTALFYSF